MTYHQRVGVLHVKTVLVSRWLPAVLCGVRSMFFDAVIRCYVMCRCIICCSLRYIMHERNEFLNLFSAAAYRIFIGLVMPVTGGRVPCSGVSYWCFAAACGGSEVFQEVPAACLVFTHPV